MEYGGCYKRAFGVVRKAEKLLIVRIRGEEVECREGGRGWRQEKVEMMAGMVL